MDGFHNKRGANLGPGGPGLKLLDTVRVAVLNDGAKVLPGFQKGSLYSFQLVGTCPTIGLFSFAIRHFRSLLRAVGASASSA